MNYKIDLTPLAKQYRKKMPNSYNNTFWMMSDEILEWCETNIQEKYEYPYLEFHTETASENSYYYTTDHMKIGFADTLSMALFKLFWM